MRRRLRPVFASLTASLFLLAAAPYLGAARQDAAPAEVTWRTDYAAALREARAGGKPLAVVFRCER